MIKIVVANKGFKDESAGLGDASKSNDCVNTDAKKSEVINLICIFPKY